MADKTLNVQVRITEAERTTQAEATLSGKHATPLTGEGTAHCNPTDENVPDIGDELATARALSDLAHQLLHVAAKDIESHTHERVDGLHP